jgi:MFS transporter, DHA1 family, tetracycline resistance protein
MQARQDLGQPALLPFWAEQLGATPMLLGAMITAYAVAQLAFTPVLGALSDRCGRRPVIVISLLLSGLPFALTALASSVAMLFAARIVGGLGASIVAAAQAIVADRIPPREQARAMGYLGAAIGLAHVAGPAAGGALSTLGATAPFWVAALLAFGNTLMICCWLPETHRRSATVEEQRVKRSWTALIRSGAMRRLAVIALVFALVTVTLETVLALFTNRTFGWVAVENGWLFAYLGIVVVAMQLGVVGRLAVRFGERTLLVAGLCATAVGLLLLGVSTTVPLAVIAIGVVGVGSGVISPLLPTLFSFASPPEQRGAVLGFAHALTAMGRMLGPVMTSGLFTWESELPFLATSLLCLLGALLSLPGREALPKTGALQADIEYSPDAGH